MAEPLHIIEMPTLRNPAFIIGLGGWTNAADVSTGCVSYLRDTLRAKKFADLEPDGFFQFSNTRPTVAIEGGKIRSLAYPSTEFYYWTNPDHDRDLVLLLGTEPDLQWRTYITIVLDLAQQLGTARLCAIGGFYDSVPHTRDVPCSGASPNAGLLAELPNLDITLTSYFGPTGIITSIMMEAQKRQLPAASVWGRAPHYIQIPNPKVWHEVLWRVMALCQLRVDTSSLMRRGHDLTQKVNETLRDNPQLREYVKQLEEAQPGELPSEPLQQDDILRSVEELLRGDEGQRLP